MIIRSVLKLRLHVASLSVSVSVCGVRLTDMTSPWLPIVTWTLFNSGANMFLFSPAYSLRSGQSTSPSVNDRGGFTWLNIVVIVWPCHLPKTTMLSRSLCSCCFESSNGCGSCRWSSCHYRRLEAHSLVTMRKLLALRVLLLLGLPNAATFLVNEPRPK